LPAGDGHSTFLPFFMSGVQLPGPEKEYRRLEIVGCGLFVQRAPGTKVNPTAEKVGCGLRSAPKYGRLRSVRSLLLDPRW